MKYKRFKTLILDYVYSVKKLDDIEWVIYMDIDILMGAPLSEILQGALAKYHIGDTSIGSEDESHISRLYFFQDVPGPFFANSGFFIINRHTSKVCLDLWRMEIDSHPQEKMDQTSLTAVARQHNLSTETECQMVVMEKKEYVEYAYHNNALTKMMKESRYTNLIHIFYSSPRVKISDGVHQEFVSSVLQLSEKEIEERKFIKADALT